VTDPAQSAARARAETPARGLKRFLRRVATVLAYAGAPALAFTTLLLRFVGEDWWLTGVALYLPPFGFGVLPAVTTALLLVLGLRRLLWTQLVAVGVLVFPLMGCVVSWPWRGGGGAPTLRVLSYNVHADLRAEAVAGELLHHRPDIVVLQEVSAESGLAERLKAHFQFVEVAGQFLVASRFPARLTEPPKFKLDGYEHSPRYVRCAIDTPLGTIALYNLHPVSPRRALLAIRGRGLKQEVRHGRLLDASASPRVEENVTLRRMELEQASIAAGRERGPVVLAGDTNLPALSSILGRYFGHYQDGFSRAGFGFGYTFPTKLPWMRIDRIMASDELAFVSFETGCGAMSDHRCVVAELRAR
jgi:endonuclease/exonuclease/phosphatase family metal-dependent hydrolase